MSVVLITGCSSGFGMLTSARLAAAGYTVYATMRDLARKDGLLTEVKRRGGEVRLLPLDVTDDTSIAGVVAKIVAEEGKLHVVINNAGYGIGGFFEDLSEDEIRAQLETNFFGVQKVLRHTLPLLRKTAADEGKSANVKIINISSGQGRSALPGVSAYAASKFALEGFSESLYFELQPFGVRVILVEPGSFHTEALDKNKRLAKRGGDPSSPYTLYSLKLQQRVDDMTKSDRGTGDPEDVARIIEKIIKDPKPRLRYVVGTATKLRLLARGILPFRWFAALVLRIAFGESR